jgi:hypothetical protein
MKWTIEFKKPNIRRGFLPENRYYLVIGVFIDYITGNTIYEEAILVWDRVKSPTRRYFLDFINDCHRVNNNGLLQGLSCVSEFKSKEDAKAYESSLGNDLIKTLESHEADMIEEHISDPSNYSDNES